MQRLAILCADGDNDLRRTQPQGGDRGTAGDIFARAGAVDSITPATTPGTRLWDGSGTNVWIHAIRVDGGVARIRITTTTTLAAEPITVPTSGVAMDPLEIRYRITGGTAPYEAVAGEPELAVEGLAVRMENDIVMVQGRPLRSGQVRVPVHVRDAAGDAWWAAPRVLIRDRSLHADQLLVPLVAPSSADEELRTYLDASATHDGVYDVRDLHAYLLRTGG